MSKPVEPCYFSSAHCFFWRSALICCSSNISCSWWRLRHKHIKVLVLLGQLSPQATSAGRVVVTWTSVRAGRSLDRDAFAYPADGHASALCFCLCWRTGSLPGHALVWEGVDSPSACLAFLRKRQQAFSSRLFPCRHNGEVSRRKIHQALVHRSRVSCLKSQPTCHPALAMRHSRVRIITRLAVQVR